MPISTKRRKRRTPEEQIADLQAEIEAIEARARQQKRFSPDDLRAKRQHLGLSQSAYAELIGVSPITIGSWENGRSRPRAKQIQSLLEVKGISKAKAWRRLGIEAEDHFSGAEIKAERARLELSAADYAELVGVSHLTIYSWEHGRSKPRKAQLERWQAIKGIKKEDAWERLGIESEFSAEEVAAERERLELSAADYGELVGVSHLTIYNWEKGKTKPQAAQLEKWLTVKGIGKRKAWRRLGY
jgi:DNA-binding transcriptional regulator YiaG